MRLRSRALPALAGPTLIVACVVFALRGFIFRDAITGEHPDILSFWIPRFCYLGHNLRAGHVPVWNSLQFIGVPYAADPQSGWLYAPVMGLFSTLSCGGAMRAFIALNPLMAGLGLYWFLRKEELHRAAATAGGLSAAMLMATSNVAISLPFAGMLAWTPFLLVGASGYVRTPTWPRRLGWLALAAVAWGQVASAHLSHGLIMATLVTAAYLVARAVHDVRRGGVPPWHAVALLAGFAAFVVGANLAILLPRIAVFSRTSLRAGYSAIGGAAARSAGLEQQPLAPSGFWSGWPLSLASAPGSYAGAAILLAVPLSLRAARRYLTAAFVTVGALAYVFTLNALAGQTWFRRLVLHVPYGDVYLHSVNRLRYLFLIVVPVLGALGIQSLIERPLPLRRAAAWVGAGVGLWLLVPLVVGAHPIRLVLLALGTAAAAPALLWLARGRRRGAAIVVAVLALELTGSAIASQSWNHSTVYLGLEQDESGRNILFQPLWWPDVSMRDFLEPGPIARAIRANPGRVDTWDPPLVYSDKGYLYEQGPPTWPALENSRPLLFGIADSMGYSPIQLTRYWSWIRAVNDLPVFYNASVLHAPTHQDLRMLAVRYLIVPSKDRPPVTGTKIATEGAYTLYEIPDDPMVSTVGRWAVVGSGAEALSAVTDPSFDPRTRAVLQRNPAIPQAPGSRATVGYGRPSPERIVLTSRSATPAVVVVHESFDPHWSYSIDGSAPRPVLAADYFLQGVPVPAGSHTIVLRYTDPSIGRGLAASAAVWGAFGVALAWAVVRRRRYSASEARASGSGSTGA